MKINRNLALAACLIAGAALTAESQAGVFGGGRHTRIGKGVRTEKTADQERARRFNRIPEMSFVRGRLALSGPGTWRLDSAEMSIRKDCIISQAGEPVTVLEEGREVMVTGAWKNGVLEAWGIDLLTSADTFATPNPVREIKVSDSDPSCGEVIGGPY